MKSVPEKTDGIQAYHGYLSFKNMEVTPEMAQRVGMEFARRVWGDKYQVLVTTHLNTEHLHCHFVVNSISFVDGSRCHDETSWFKFSPIADEICRKYGLSVIQEPDRNRDPYYIKQKEQAGIPTRQSILRETIDEIVPHCRNLDDFKYQLRQRGYKYNLNPSRKYWTVAPPGSEKSIRLYRLGEEYTNDRIAERIRKASSPVNTLLRHDPVTAGSIVCCPGNTSSMRRRVCTGNICITVINSDTFRNNRIESHLRCTTS